MSPGNNLRIILSCYRIQAHTLASVAVAVPFLLPQRHGCLSCSCGGKSCSCRMAKVCGCAVCQCCMITGACDYAVYRHIPQLHASVIMLLVTKASCIITEVCSGACLSCIIAEVCGCGVCPSCIITEVYSCGACLSCITAEACGCGVCLSCIITEVCSCGACLSCIIGEACGCGVCLSSIITEVCACGKRLSCINSEFCGCGGTCALLLNKGHNLVSV